ncbi:MAG: hypothetical protein KF832_01895 [Caldilineaceae bacterium]|nr:hypothetical protein [Caldilineaceae bacterium]
MLMRFLKIFASQPIAICVMLSGLAMVSACLAPPPKPEPLTTPTTQLRPLAATFTSTPSSPVITATAVVAATPTDSPRFLISSAMQGGSAVQVIDISNDIPISRMPEKQSWVIWVTINSTHLYWVTDREMGSIFRYPLAGGEIEKIVTTQFPEGVFFYIRHFLSDDWLVYLDAAGESMSTSWRLLAYNLKTGATVTVLENRDKDWAIPEFFFNDDKVAWTVMDFTKSVQGCNETVVGYYDLSKGLGRELERVCSEQHYVWGNPSISGNTIILGQQTADKQENIVQFDLTNNQWHRITQNGHSSIPEVMFPWATWKDGFRYGNASQSILYNLQTGSTLPIGFTNLYRLDEPALGQARWLYWHNRTTAENPIYVYNLESNVAYKIASVDPKSEQELYSVNIYKNHIVWWHIDQAGVAPQLGNFEWATLP